jgi:hypothetical protein
MERPDTRGIASAAIAKLHAKSIMTVNIGIDGKRVFTAGTPTLEPDRPENIHNVEVDGDSDQPETRLEPLD